MKQHSGSKIADKFQMAAITDQNDVTKHFKRCSSIAVSECMSILQRGSDSERVLSRCNNGSSVTTSICEELHFTPISRNGALK